ncbi:hypothetical protein DXG01_005980, partial [Tephrocybe rancida]
IMSSMQLNVVNNDQCACEQIRQTPESGSMPFLDISELPPTTIINLATHAPLSVSPPNVR